VYVSICYTHMYRNTCTYIYVNTKRIFLDAIHLCLCVSVSLCLVVSVCLCACGLSISVSLCLYVSVSLCLCVSVSVFSVSTYLCVPVYVYARVCVGVYVSLCACTPTHTRTNPVAHSLTHACTRTHIYTSMSQAIFFIRKTIGLFSFSDVHVCGPSRILSHVLCHTHSNIHTHFEIERRSLPFGLIICFSRARTGLAKKNWMSQLLHIFPYVSWRICTCDAFHSSVCEQD